MQLQGKTAVVTGAGRGIGEAVARLFAAEGAAVVVAARTAREGEATVASIRAAGGEATFHQTDVRRGEQVRRLIDESVRRYGHLDALVNNAGIEGPGKPLAEASEDEWDAVIDTNLKGCFLGMRYAIPHMRQVGGGAIVNVSSVLADQSLPGLTAYTASKAGIVGLTRATALEVGQFGIRVNCIQPGSTDTPMMWAGLDEAGRREVEPIVAAAQPLGTVGRPEEIAQVALFLVSDASSFVTGASLVADGGLLTRIATVR
ncbi:MAG: SDR family NAD(P)-dependent oxidoreductase [Thermomicrobiales bacterium]|nr:SDR family oxidoreductase [Chloroflexia bacterium]